MFGWIRRSLERQFMVSAASGVFLFVLVAGIGTYRFAARKHLEAYQENVTELGITLGLVISDILKFDYTGEFHRQAYLGQTVNRITEQNKKLIKDIAIVNSEGELLARTNWIPDQAPMIVPKALRTPLPPGHLQRSTDSLFLSVPLVSAGYLWGSMQITSTLGEYYTILSQLRNRMLLSSVLFLIAGIICAGVLARALAKPIKEMAEKISKAAPPDFRTDITPSRTDEIGSLQSTIVAWTNRLSSLQSTLNHRQRLATIGTLTAGLAHEMNNPIAGMQVCSRRLRKKIATGQDPTKFLDLMDQSLVHLQEVVSGLLSFSSRKEIEKNVCDLQLLVNRSVALVGPKIKSKSINLSIHIDEKVQRLSARETDIVQLLTNLVKNSTDAVPVGGSISIDASPCTKGHHCMEKNKCKSTENGCKTHGTVIRITDNGPGIDPDLEKNIWEPFFTTKDPGEGTGLGLTMCQKIVQNHNGKLILKSKSGGGTIAEVTLPETSEQAI